jgi:outer membrane receptor protein involved in Fe transport
LGRIEVVTKTGSSAFHGEFNFVASDYRLNARNAFAAERPREHYRQYEGNISGPLGKGRKASFLISGEYEDEDERPIIYAIGPNGPIQENVHNPKHGAQFSARLNRQVGRQNMLSLRYEFEDESQPTQGVGGFVLHEAGVEEAGRNHHVYLNQRTFVTKSLINDLSVRIGSHNDATRSLNAGAPGIVVLDAFTGGGAQADARSTENHLQLTNMLSWSRGRHFVKTGISIPDFDRRGLNDRTNFGGTFYFSSLQDYALGRPFSYVRQQGQSRLVFWHKELSLFFQDDIRIRPNLSVAVGLRYDWQNYLPDRNNFAPRFSFAYSPGSARKTVLRGGAGVFYDKTGPEAISDVLRLDGRRILRFVVSNPGYPVPVAGGDVTPPSVVRFAPDVQSPYVMQYSFGVERQLRRSTTFTSNYTGTTGVKFFRSRDVNAPPPPAYAGRPNPAVGILRQIESSARQESHSLRLGVRGDMSRFFNGSIEYTLGRAYNDTGGIASFPADHYDLRGEWARADFDKRHLVTLYGTVKLGKLADLGVVSTFSSGQPYSLTTGLDLNRDSFAADRPSGVRRNTLTGSGRFRLDLRWSKEWPLSAARKDDGPKLSFGIEAYNVLNFVSYDKFVGNLSSPLFGLPVSSRPSRRLHLYSGIRF